MTKQQLGGKREGSGRPKGLPRGEKLFDLKTIAVPAELVPSIRDLVNQYKELKKQLIVLEKETQKQEQKAAWRLSTCLNIRFDRTKSCHTKYSSYVL